MTWLGIADLNFDSLIGTSLATELGLLDQERKNLQSTKSFQIKMKLQSFLRPRNFTSTVSVMSLIRRRTFWNQ